MNVKNLPRTLGNWQFTGLGRTPGSVLYLAPNEGNRTHELLLGKIAFAGHQRSTVIFENSPAVPPVAIEGDAAKHQLAVGKHVLVEITFAGPGEVRIMRWFRAGGSQSVPTIKKTPQTVKAVTAARVTAVIIKVDPDFRFAFAERHDGTRYFVPAKSCGFPLRMHARLSFSTTPSAEGQLPVAADVRAA